MRTHVSGLAGSRDILFQMGYTENIQDGVSFPEDVKEPNVEMLKDMAADLFLARYEIEALMAQTHLYLHLVSPHSADSTTTGQSKPGSAGSPRIPGSLAPSVGQVSSNTAQPQVRRMTHNTSISTNIVIAAHLHASQEYHFRKL